jgi:hypothetical protein
MSKGIEHPYNFIGDANYVISAPDLSRLLLRAATMNFRHHGVNLDTPPDNVIAFPCVHRDRLAPTAGIHRSYTRRNKQPVAITGAELNARLLILLGICATSAALALSAAHILQG